MKKEYYINTENGPIMQLSIHCNPFVYIKSDIDIQKLVTNLINVTIPEGASHSDAFWEKAEKLLLSALLLYTWMEKPPEEQNYRTVMDLLSKAECQTDVRGNKLDSELDMIFSELETRECTHPAVLEYNTLMRGASATVRNAVILSAKSRLKCVNQDILAFLALLDNAKTYSSNISISLLKPDK